MFDKLRRIEIHARDARISRDSPEPLARDTDIPELSLVDVIGADLDESVGSAEEVVGEAALEPLERFGVKVDILAILRLDVIRWVSGRRILPTGPLRRPRAYH